MFSLRNGLYTLLSKSNVTSRKSAVFKLHCIVIDKPHPLKSLTIAFFFLSISSFETLENIPRPSSRYKPISDLLTMDVSLFKIDEPNFDFSNTN